MSLHCFLLAALTLADGALSSGCAAIVKGTTQDIPTSEPSGARVLVDENLAGTKPTKVTMNRKKSHVAALPTTAIAGFTLSTRDIACWIKS